MALRDLTRLGLVYRETPDSGKRFVYRAESDIWLVITRIFREHERERLGAILEQIEHAERLVRPGTRGVQTQEEIFRLDQIRHLVSVGRFAMNLLDAFMERTKVELKAAQKWLSVSERLGGEPLSKIRRAINASRLRKKR